MAEKSREETETSFWQSAADRGTWEVFSEDAYWITRLEKAGAVLIAELPGGGKRYTIRGNQLGLRKGLRKPMSDERKAQVAMRLAQGRKTQAALGETPARIESTESEAAQ